jgi:diaminohydroxyphosphoribosylaminopyrimidine deaminase/5-amino-6-(5-phosphoribosylamino)uracil reductase
MHSDMTLMRRALALAELGRGSVSPNPMVGCVLAKNGRIIAEGHHAVFGGPHAEAVALAKAGGRARGATAYVTLEPCSHWGKTPPCAESLVKAGVSKVFVAVKDPHKKVSGKGISLLRRAGVQVELGLLKDESHFLNRAFFKVHTTGLPYVVWKTAQTLDGKIVSHSGVSKWITNTQARALGHQLRAESDAVLVGGETLRRDNPLLTSHGRGSDPIKLILSASLNLPLGSKAFKEGECIVLTKKNAPERRVRALEARGVKILKQFVKFSREEFVDCFRVLSKIGVIQLLIEGGGETSDSILSAGLMDEVYHVMAFSYLGGRDAKTCLEGTGWGRPDQGPRLSNVDLRFLGDNLLVHGFLKKRGS